jgi:hypothetical protein
MHIKVSYISAFLDGADANKREIHRETYESEVGRIIITFYYYYFFQCTGICK